MALSVLSLAYNLHFSPLEDENVSTRPSLHSLQSIYWLNLSCFKEIWQIWSRTLMLTLFFARSWSCKMRCRFAWHEILPSGSQHPICPEETPASTCEGLIRGAFDRGRIAIRGETKVKACVRSKQFSCVLYWWGGTTQVWLVWGLLHAVIVFGLSWVSASIRQPHNFAKISSKLL